MSPDVTYESFLGHRFTTPAAGVLSQVLERARERRLLLDEPLVAAVALWTLLRSEQKVAHHVLATAGVDLEELGRQVDRLLERGQRLPSCSGEPFDRDADDTGQTGTAALQSLAERSREEAARLERDYIGTEHLLLAIISMADPPLACLLSHFRISYVPIRETVIKVLGP